MSTALVLILRDGNSKRYSPQHWLMRAQEARDMARGIKDSDARDEMETIARLYERLAEFTGRRLPGRTKN